MSFVLVKDSLGNVYGQYDLPAEVHLSTEEWARKISETLDERVGVHATKLQEAYGVGTREGVIADIDTPRHEIGSGPSEAVLTAVGIIAISTLPECSQPN